MIRTTGGSWNSTLLGKGKSVQDTHCKIAGEEEACWTHGQNKGA